MDYKKKATGFDDRFVSKTETERRPFGEHHFTGGVATDRIPESLNESGHDGGASVGVGKSAAMLGVAGSNPHIRDQKEDSPNRGAFGTS